MRQEEARKLGEDVLQILAENGGELAKTSLIKNLRNSRWTASPISGKWSFSAYFINYKFDDILAEQGVDVRRKGGSTYFSI